MKQKVMKNKATGDRYSDIGSHMFNKHIVEKIQNRD